MKNGDTSRDRCEAEATGGQSLPGAGENAPEDQTDWGYLAAMSGEEAHLNALADPDNPPLTTEQLARFRRSPNPKQLRLRLNLTQEEFARQFQIGLYMLRDWEDGVRRPDSVARTYLHVIEAIPDAVRQALASEPSSRDAPVAMEAPRRRTG